MCCGCCCCCKNRGKVHGYVGPPTQQPVTVTAIITQPAPTPAPVTLHYSSYPTVVDSSTATVQSSRQAPPPYTESATAPLHLPTVHYPKQNAYNPNY